MGLFALISIYLALCESESGIAWPTSLTIGLIGLVCFLGPLAGAIGSRTMNYPLTGIYMAYCLVKFIGHITFGIYMFFFWYLLFVFVQFWICKITGMYLLALGRVAPSRRKELISLDAKDTVQMVYW